MGRWCLEVDRAGAGNALLALLAACLSAALDLATKALALKALAPGEIREVAPFLNLVLAENRGAAFSLLAGPGESQAVLMATLSALALLPLIWIFRALGPSGRATHAFLGAILGGALGNIADRLRRGAVVDFLDFHWGGAHWPAFNAADVFVVAGVLWLLGSLGLCTWRDWRAGGPRPGRDPGAGAGRRRPRKGRGSRKGRGA
ncbi:MAG: signal peptidase II [Deltaproteobacteria bacterium]|jgi:signal peptidase II|nr:signal peptidase II [Deltaproteobacteria bacterium]